MAMVHELASFVIRSTYEDLSEEARAQIKIRVLDSLGCAIGALGGEPIEIVRAQLEDFDGAGSCTLIGGGRAAPDRAAFYNGALVRYLDYNDSYLSKGETGHPSDNIGATLAAAEYARVSGKEFMTALAVAYQVQCRLSDVAPVRHKGFDHTTQGSYAVAAGVSKALGMKAEQTAHAIAISGAALNALRVTRTGRLSHWKGLAYPHTAFGATHAAFLAMRGITGPLEIFEGNKGFMDAIAGPFEIDWSKENLERVTRTIIKKFNAEIHSQSAIEGVLELKSEYGLNSEAIEKIEIEIFDVAYHIIGGGEEGAKTLVQTKEEADHSLPYMLAVALLDGEVTPAQYRSERIRREDVQKLLRKVEIRPTESYSRLFPDLMPCQLTVSLKDGRILRKEKMDYEGFFTRPASWESVLDKFKRLAALHVEPSLSDEIVAAAGALENIQAGDLAGLLGRVSMPRGIV
ncbi:MAG: MmgE/PrpD family protein [Anaerolineales bacterium]|nr:MmgE/PrpD family protein [Anaerolineales bacterium]